MLGSMACPPMTIANGNTTSNVLDYTVLGDAESILIEAPAALDAGTYTLEVSQDGVTYVTLQDSSAADQKVPGAGKGIVYYLSDLGGAQHLRIKGPAAAADRVFKVSKHLYF